MPWGFRAAILCLVITNYVANLSWEVFIANTGMRFRARQWKEQQHEHTLVEELLADKKEQTILANDSSTQDV